MERIPSQEEIFQILKSHMRFYIHLCMELAMNKAQAADVLASQFNIPQTLTQTVWEMLEEEEHPGAFGYYNEMAELQQQNITNFLYQLREHNGDGSSVEKPLLRYSPF